MQTMLDKYAPLRNEAGGQGGDGTGGTQGATWSAPAGLPQEFAGATADETLGKLLGGYTDLNTRTEGLRTKLATLPKAPDSFDKYTFEPGEKLAPYFGDMTKMPAMDFAKQAAHKHGLSQEQFAGFVSDVYGPMAEQGLLAQPFNPQKEIDSFMTELGLDRAAGAAALSEAETFAKGLSGQLKGVPDKMKPDVEAALMSLTDTAAGNVLLRAISGRLAEGGIRIAGEAGNGGNLSAEDLKKLDADPRIDPANRNHPDMSKRYDEALRAQYDAAYKVVYPNK